MQLSIKKIYVYIIALSILVTPGISYGSIYPFHILIPIILLYIYIAINKEDFKVDKIVIFTFIFFSYVVISCFFLQYTSLVYLYLFYLFCLILCFYGAYFLSRDYICRIYLIRIMVIFSITLVVIGFLESSNILRMPFSPYSDYYSLFGKNKDLSDWGEDLYAYNTQKPTGFSANPNTFGFVFLVFLPFIELLKNKILKFLLFSFSFFIIFKIDSKTIFFAFLVYIILNILISNKKNLKTTVAFFIFIFLFLIIFPLIEFSENRMFLVFSELQKGIEFLFANNSLNEEGSTAKRALLYSLGLEQFFNTYGIGLGLSGVESFLSAKFGQHTAFHNFFLMMLIDLGLIAFIFIVLFYVKLLLKLYLKYKSTNNNIYKVLFLSILVSVFSSIAPSGIFYILPYWFVLGLSCYYAYSVEVSSEI